jgi:hypothetical protein
MKYPDCDKPSECRFSDRGGSVTLMYSPISYDRDGRPVSGGSNKVNKCLRCDACGKYWTSQQTELEDAQGVERKWEEST